MDLKLYPKISYLSVLALSAMLSQSLFRRILFREKPKNLLKKLSLKFTKNFSLQSYSKMSEVGNSIFQDPMPLQKQVT